MELPHQLQTGHSTVQPQIRELLSFFEERHHLEPLLLEPRFRAPQFLELFLKLLDRVNFAKLPEHAEETNEANYKLIERVEIVLGNSARQNQQTNENAKHELHMLWRQEAE